jgi:hypothetical protein
MAISKMKNGKATEPTEHDKIPAKLIIEGGKELEKDIYELI